MSSGLAGTGTGADGVVASSWGVAGLWLFYGLVIGIVGVSIGMVLAWLIVTNINPIHEWMGTTCGSSVWGPRV